MANPGKTSAEKTSPIEEGIEYGVGKLIDFFGDDLAGDNKQFKKAMSTPEGKKMIKKMAAKAIVDVLAAGAPTDDEGKPIHTTRAAQIEAGLGTLISDMAMEASSAGKIKHNVVHIRENARDLKRQVNKEIEGIIYDAQEPLREAEKLLHKAANWLS